MVASSKKTKEDIVEEFIRGKGFIDALTILWCWANYRTRILLWGSFGLAIAGIGFIIAGFFWQPAFQIACPFVLANFILIAYILGMMTVKSKALDMIVEVINGETESK